MKFLDALIKTKEAGKQVVIPDIKRFSPKDGELLGERSAAEYAKMLLQAGAPVLSVVTEEKEFHGSLSMLREIADAVDVPILRKDFIHTREDLIETVNAGASAILLMCSCLTKDELCMLYHQALELGLDPFVETHLPEDFEIVNELNARLVGINNRDILKLERDDGDVNHTVGMLSLAPDDAFIVTESSIKDPEEVRIAIRNGADAALVGTAIALAPDPALFYKMLTSKISLKICGLMNEADINMCVASGVERMGIVCEYPLDVPWDVSREKAAQLRKFVPKGYRCVLVTGGETEKILELAELIKPDMVQLHYKESLEESAFIAAELKKQGIAVIRTVPVNSAACMEQFGTDDIEAVIESLCETDIAELLVDPRHGADIAKKNLQADEELFALIKSISTKPVILAGGLKPENIAEKLASTKAEAVDIMNGSETEPGSKDAGKVAAIVRAVIG